MYKTFSTVLYISDETIKTDILEKYDIVCNFIYDDNCENCKECKQISIINRDNMSFGRVKDDFYHKLAEKYNNGDKKCILTEEHVNNRLTLNPVTVPMFQFFVYGIHVPEYDIKENNALLVENKLKEIKNQLCNSSFEFNKLQEKYELLKNQIQKINYVLTSTVVCGIVFFIGSYVKYILFN